jgi:glucosamine--fructose-6-phosphate aminotransferase (isomerizing)
MNLGKNMANEIAEQPEVFSRIFANQSEINAVAKVIAKRNPRAVLFAGRGTSDHAAIYGKYLIEIELGLPSGLVSPSSFTVYSSRPKYKDVLFVVVSQSGGSPDLVESARIARECGATVLAITNNPDSDLAKAAEFHIYVHAGPEIAVAATKSYSAQMLVLKLLTDAILEKSDDSINQLPEAAARISVMQSQFDDFAKGLSGISRLILTGRGYAYPTALETALKIMETVYIDAHAFSAADLLHGPMAMIEANYPVLAVVPDGHSFSSVKPVLERLATTTDQLFVVGGSSASSYGNFNLNLDHGLSEQISPMLDIIALQNIVWRMSISAGNDPDNPRGLKKVTKTL